MERNLRDVSKKSHSSSFNKKNNFIFILYLYICGRTQNKALWDTQVKKENSLINKERKMDYALSVTTRQPTIRFDAMIAEKEEKNTYIKID